MMFKSRTYIIMLICVPLIHIIWPNTVTAQAVAINDNNSGPDVSAMLHIHVFDTRKKGLLIPRMLGTERAAIINPADGLLVYQTDAPHGFWYFDGNYWKQLGVGGGCTLDDAYDFGGAGAGSIINADVGPVRIDGTEGLVATGSAGVGTIPATGAGVRMMWYPKKLAFRAGGVNADQWDDINVGNGSFACGGETKASGDFSAALNAFTASQGIGSTSLGMFSHADSYASVAIGSANIGGGDALNWVASDPLFEIGIGNLSGSKNAMTVLKNGNVGIGTHQPDAMLHVDGRTKIDGQIEITGGAPGQGKVLTSDGSGLASWETPPQSGGGDAR